MRKLFRAGMHVTIWGLVIFVALAALNFPYSYDRPLSETELATARNYYADAYRRQSTPAQAETQYQTRYEEISARVAEAIGIEKRIAAFVESYGLRDKKILDVGSGRGHLQDIVTDYTGLDISPAVAPLYRKKFVLGSATAMPFPENSFDAAWSVFVLEHIPDPEHALREMRRVIRDGGLLYLLAAWNCPSWLADGYEVRSYADLNLQGKLIKASLPLRSSPAYNIVNVIPARIVRSAASVFGATALRYHRLTPNYETYWQPDSDAVVSIDSFEALMWFLSRGDECLNCPGEFLLPLFESPLIIRVNKGGPRT
jgi:SAM-dependent methyltransferase